MILYIVRHAWAGHFGDPAWPDDFQRPLTENGKARFCRVVEALVERGFAPQIVATSPLVRCRETAEIIRDVVPNHPRVVALDELAPAGSVQALLEWTLETAGDLDQVAWVGHAPDVGQLTAALIGDGAAWFRFAKGAVAAIEFDEALEPGEGELRWLVTAKLLGCP